MVSSRSVNEPLAAVEVDISDLDDINARQVKSLSKPLPVTIPNIVFPYWLIDGRFRVKIVLKNNNSPEKELGCLEFGLKIRHGK